MVSSSFHHGFLTLFFLLELLLGAFIYLYGNFNFISSTIIVHRRLYALSNSPWDLLLLSSSNILACSCWQTLASVIKSEGIVLTLNFIYDSSLLNTVLASLLSTMSSSYVPKSSFHERSEWSGNDADTKTWAWPTWLMKSVTLVTCKLLYDVSPWCVTKH